MRKITPMAEELEIALAWLEDELTLTDIALMRGKLIPSNGLSWIAPRLRECYKLGLIKVVREGGDG